MKLKWLKDKLGEKFYPIAHATGVVVAENKTLDSKLSEIDTEIGNKANKTEIPNELPANGGNSATVNEHTVKSDVPENAVFTDTVYDDTEIQQRISDNGYGEVAGGKNLLPRINLHTTYNGVALNTNKDGSISLSGTVTTRWTKIVLIDTTLSAGEYTFSIGTLISQTYLEVYFDDVQQEVSAAQLYSFTLTKDTKVRIRYSWDLVTFNHTIYPQLELGLVATSYEPYFPSNKMLMEEKVDKSETTVNLFNPPFVTTTFNGVTFINNGDGSVSISGAVEGGVSAYTASVLVPVNIGQTYRVIGKCVAVYKKDNTTQILQTLITEDTTPYTFTAMEDAVNVCMYIPNKDTDLGDGVISYPMLTTNLNATIDDFVPYTGDTGSLNGDVAEKAPKANPVFTGSISMGRAKNSTIGEYSTAIGDFVDASGRASHSEGSLTTASGMNSHAEGENTTASGHASHSEGVFTIASGNYSHAEGGRTVSLNYQHAGGHHNNTNTAMDSKSSGTGTGTSFVIGNGTATSKSNAFRVDDNGTPYSKAGLNTTGADYAEFFEWEDGNENNEDRRGYFVTLDGKHIKIANEGDWILGIVSGFPAIIGNGDEEWKGRYVFDDFGCPVIEEFEYEEEISEVITNEDDEEEVITKKVKRTGTKWKELPEYDPERPYVQRSERQEWSAVGMLGVLSVRDDGSCKVNGFCKLADGGIATASDTGYRVVKRVTDNIVEVIFK